MDKENVSSGNILDLTVLKKLLLYVIPYKQQFYLLLFLTFILGFLSPFRVYLIQVTLDKYVSVGDYNGMVIYVLFIVGVLIVHFAFQYIHTYISGLIGQNVIRDIRVKLYAHIVRLQVRFFDRTPIGRLVTRTISDVETLADVFSDGLANMLSDFLQIGCILIFMFWTDWKMTLVSMSVIPLWFIVTYIFKEKIKVTFNDVRNAVSNLNSFVQEHITGMNIVQIFGNEKNAFEKFKVINREHRDANLKSVLYYSVYFPVAEIIAAMGIGLLVWYGARGLMQSEVTGVTIGTLTAFIMYINMLFRPIRQIADRYNTLQLGIVSTSRIINLLDATEHVIKNGSYKPVQMIGEVTFDHVWFAYQAEEYVLKDINLNIEAGQTIAIVGATGAGKSSIINLITRFYDIERGSILIDGEDIKNYDLDVLRKNIGVVLQDVFLFSDTIRNNISFGSDQIPDETIMEAAIMVGVEKFIEQLPGKLNYNVMERGNTLSVGQQQLLSFIRAMLYKPKILIMDEATSSIDTETEEMLQVAIEKMMANRTSIIIAHRLSTIKKADKIIVLDKGVIKETGTHSELLNLNGYYAQLHKMQFKEIV